MIYLDNAATTRMSNKALATIVSMQEMYANSSSLHSFGFECEKKLEQARDIIAESMGVSPDTVYFTSGGTMSDNIAIRGYLSTKKRGRIITSQFEHPAVLECFRSLESVFEVIYVKPENGYISTSDIEKNLSDDTIFVSIMHVNNETGAINDIKGISSLLKEKNIVFHTDSVQGYLKESFKYSNVDMASFSGHKTHGPKGIGAIYIRKGLRVNPVIYGGGQEKNIHSGTINTIGACAWAEAVNELMTGQKERYSSVKRLNTEYRKKLKELGADIISPENGSPYILNFAFKGILGENLLHYLSEKQIYVSTGSACSSKKGSYVLKAVGEEKLQKFALRMSFSDFNTMKETDIVIKAIKEGIASLERIRY